MNKPDTLMKRKYADTYRRTFDAPKLASAEAPPEPQAQSARRSVADGSLPVSSAEALLKRWDEAAAGYRKGGEISNAVANVFEICASDLRRQMESTNERQPEENNADLPTLGRAEAKPKET